MFDIDKIRSEFPILSREVHQKPLIYLDSASTAQKPLAVIECVDELHRNLNSNIHRGVHYLSEECTELYEGARAKVASFIGAAQSEECIFTSGATDALNLVARTYGEDRVEQGDNIVLSHIEHHSNIVAWQMLAERKGAQLRVISVDDSGALNLDELDNLIDNRTRIVAITQASNTLGTRPNLKRVVNVAHSVGAVVVVDGCQGVVHGGVDVADLDCDFYTFSGHKLYAPTGIGVLYGKRELLDAMPPFKGGGDMVDRVSFSGTTYAPTPLKFEAGTSNYIGAIGLGKAIDFIQSLDKDALEAHERALLQSATEQLLAIEGLNIYGTTDDKCSIVSFNVEGVHPYDLGSVLDKMGVAIRTGQHCAEPTMQRFGVRGMCRASFAMYNTLQEVDALANGVARAVKMLK